MLNEKILRPALFIIVAALHAIVILFFVIRVSSPAQNAPENARVMMLTDLAEIPPAPPPPAPPPTPADVPQVEAIAEVMIETDIQPVHEVVAPGTIITPGPVVADEGEHFLPMHLVSQPPRFDERSIAADLIYPEIARRSGIEGRVILELFVDRNGVVQQVRILQESPPDRGFGEAAVRAFAGRVGQPAMSNGQPVSSRFRYPVVFRLR